jgi:hypothetical protein
VRLFSVRGWLGSSHRGCGSAASVDRPFRPWSTQTPIIPTGLSADVVSRREFSTVATCADQDLLRSYGRTSSACSSGVLRPVYGPSAAIAAVNCSTVAGGSSGRELDELVADTRRGPGTPEDLR